MERARWAPLAALSAMLCLPASAAEGDLKPLLTLKENLTIGGGADEAKGIGFSQIAAIQADDEGDIYVLDYKECLVKVFDPQGKLIRSFGKKGQGPGDFQAPAEMRISGRDLTVFDWGSTRISRFDLDGRNRGVLDLKTVGADMFLPRVEVSGSVFGLDVEDRGDGAPVQRLIRYGLADKKTQVIATTPLGPTGRQKIRMTKTGLYIQPLPDGRTVWIDTNEYALNFLTPDGRPDFRRTKEYKPVRINERHKKELLEPYLKNPALKGWTFEWPEYFPPIMNLVAADNGWLIVMDWPTEKGQRQYDVFGGGEYEYLGSFFHPEGETLATVKSNSAYFQLQDAEGYPLVKRYAIELLK